MADEDDPIDFTQERARRLNDNRNADPVAVLRLAADEIEAGERPCDSVVVLMLNRGENDDSYGTSMMAADIRNSEIVALMEVLKIRLMQEMGAME